MRRVCTIVLALAAALFAAPAARALDYPLHTGSVGVTAELARGEGVIAARYLVRDLLALSVRAGYARETRDAFGREHTLNDYSVGFGLREYLEAEDVAPFWGLNVDYVRNQVVAVECVAVVGGQICDSERDAVNGIDLDLHIGFEYFMTPALSAELRAGVALVDRWADTDTTRLGTFTSAVAVTYNLP